MILAIHSEPAPVSVQSRRGNLIGTCWITKTKNLYSPILQLRLEVLGGVSLQALQQNLEFLELKSMFAEASRGHQLAKKQFSTRITVGVRE